MGMTATVKTEMIETVAEIGRAAVAGTVMKAPINARKTGTRAPINGRKTATKAPISARKIKIKMKAPRARKLATKVQPRRTGTRAQRKEIAMRTAVARTVMIAQINARKIGTRA